MSHFQEDSPQFRQTLQDHEDSLTKLCTLFRLWNEKAQQAHTKGEEYCSALRTLFTTIEESSQTEALSSYRSFFSTISEVLTTVQACNEGLIYSLSHVFPAPLIEFSNSLPAEIQQLKKNYEKAQKDLEALKTSTLTYKKSYVKKNPSLSEEHFLKLHNTEKNYESARFDYFSIMTFNLVQGQLLAVEQCLSLVYSIYSFTNTTIDKYKGTEKEVEKVSERIVQNKKGLVSMQESLRKEKDAQDLRINMFVKIPQYKDDKSGYLWKRGNLLTEWKRRYFFIRDSQLCYYRDGEVIVYVSLLMIKAYESKDHDNLFAFEVLSISPYNKYTFIADSEAEMKEWLHVLKKSSEQNLLGFSDTDYSCADCLTLGPEWCSLNLGVLLCSACSGIHRSLGSHLSKVRSLSLDSIDPIIKEIVYVLHKEHMNLWGEGFRPPRYCNSEEREEYIRSKYCLKNWVKKVENPSGILIEGVKDDSITMAFQGILAGAKIGEGGLLHIAAHNGSIKMVAFLIMAGWPIEAKNKEAFTPLEVALLAGKNEVVEYIVKMIS